MKPLQNRVVVVTGAGRGVGLGIARACGRRGARLILAELDANTGEAAAVSLRTEGIDCRYIHTDVTDPYSINNMVEETTATFGQIDSLVNNVGITSRQPLSDLTLEEWHRVVNANLTSIYNCVTACVPSLKYSLHAAIVNIRSVNAYRTIKSMGAYPATKAGIIGLTTSLAIDLAPNIRVNAVAPGVILTEMWAEQMVDVDAAIADRIRYIPRKRVGNPDDVGNAVAFLLSDDADFITGTVLRVDGGMLSQLYAEVDT